MKENLGNLNPTIPIIKGIRNSISDSEWIDTRLEKFQFTNHWLTNVASLGIILAFT